MCVYAGKTLLITTVLFRIMSEEEKEEEVVVVVGRARLHWVRGWQNRDKKGGDFSWPWPCLHRWPGSPAHLSSRELKEGGER